LVETLAVAMVLVAAVVAAVTPVALVALQHMTVGPQLVAVV
jgi:hypothetical protein